ncbi:MAG: ATP-binding cassette domain-containing protein [Chloroflexi bacterium]|nr:ATP-binding cassette domain-containing protein [Chloroflexota bacterium]
MEKPSQKSPLLRLLGYSREHRRQTILASTCSILNKIFDLAPPVLIGMAVDVVVEQDESFLASLGFTDPAEQLVILGILTIVIWGFESLFQYLYSILWRNLAQTVQHDLRIDAYSHLQDLDMAYFEDRSSGSLISILNDDVNQLERFLDHGANELWQLVTTVIVIGLMFIILAPSVAWMALLPMPFVLYGSLRFQRQLAPRYVSVRERVGILNGQLINNVSGVATIKSFTAELFERQRIQYLSDDYRESNHKAIKLSSAFVPMIRMIIVVGFLSILVFGGFLVLSGQLNVGIYSILVFMTQRLLWPLTRLGETLDLYQRAMASTARVLDLLDTHAKINSGDRPLPINEVRGEVAFEGVGFTYQNRIDSEDGESTEGLHPVIRDLTLHVTAGHTVAIVGATGSGKSTVVKLLLRFYDVQNGSICLDGLDIRELQLRDLRRAIGFVSQDVFLFHGTVRENISYGSFDASLEEVIAAAKTAEAHDFIMELPKGYNTIVGERGQKLSGGQRQRLSIARAVLKDPPVLILDEATSAVDNETEAAIQRSMERIIVGRTTIVIAHRLSTVRNADTIYVLDRGELCEHGRHEELVENNGIYAALWRVQTGTLVAA